MTNAIQEALNEALNDNACTPHSALAILFMDTAYRLGEQRLKRENGTRAKQKLPALKPNMFKSINLVSGFHTYFVETPLDEDGTPQWAKGDRTNLMPVFYDQMDNLTQRLLEHAEHIQDIDLAITARLVIDEREKGKYAIPDASGPSMEAFVDEIANKVVYYGSRLTDFLRKNGGGTDFAPKTSLTVDDLDRARNAVLTEARELGDTDSAIDHPEEQVTSFTLGNALNAKSDTFAFEAVELEKAENLQAVVCAWMNILDGIDGGQEALKDELKYFTARVSEYVDTLRKQEAANSVGCVR